MVVALFSHWYCLTVTAWLMNVPIIELNWLTRPAATRWRACSTAALAALEQLICANKAFC